MDFQKEDQGLVEKFGAKFVTEATDAVQLKFVRNREAFDNRVEDEDAEWYTPEFTHQHFGELEKIIGYENLSVSLVYSAATLRLFLEIEYDSKLDEVDKSIKVDDIEKSIRELWPENQPIETSADKFRNNLEAETGFVPFGELVHSYSQTNKTGGSSTYDVYYCAGNVETAGWADYVGRMQSLAFWMIDAANYTDTDDPKWSHFTLYEKYRSSEGRVCYAFAGYVSVYNYYAYPEHLRPRIAHTLLLPAYRSQGHGPQLLQAVYNQLVPLKHVVDITAEFPSDNFVQVRDFVDVINCSELSSYAPDQLHSTFTPAMYTQAHTLLKLPKKQCNRVYEILRLKYTEECNTEQMAAYKSYVLTRLNKPFQRNKRDWQKLTKQLDEEELKKVQEEENTDQHAQVLDQLYDQLIHQYRTTLERVSAWGSTKTRAVLASDQCTAADR